MKQAFFWKLLERFGVQGIQFILQILLARILSPEHYGILSLMLIFTALANVFIQNGFNTALIQNKDVTEEDYSSVFWVSLGIAAVMYGIIYISAPAIAVFYSMPDIVLPLRVLALTLIPGAFNSIQLAKVSREMDFKKVFYSNIAGILLAGIVSIVIAYMGGGLWALVVQNMLNIIVACIVMLFTVKWRPQVVCNWKRICVLFRFGWKILVSGLLNTLYQNLCGLVIGKKYDSETLAYYDRGNQFPQFIITSINSTVQSVMLPAMSAEQDNKTKVKEMMRTSITISAYIIFPMMAGLAAVATPLVKLLLTEKWLLCVPYMQLCCFTLAFHPIHICNLQAITAMGRSDIFLRLEILKKGIAVAALCVVVACFDSPIAISMTGVFTTTFSCLINAAPNKKLIDYSYFEQMGDLLPTFFASLTMMVFVMMLGMLELPVLFLLILQVCTGIFVYLLISVIFRLKPFQLLLTMAKMRRK